MKRFVRIITLILIFIALFTQVAQAEQTESTVQFTDLDEAYWSYESIEKLVEAGFIVGYPDGSFQPDGDITRAELIKVVNQVFSYTQKQESTSFIDVKSEDWFFDNVLIAQKAGYISGYSDGKFNPNGLVTRQELCKVLNSINNFVELPYDATIADEVSTWAVEYVNKVVSNRIMMLDENNNFRATEKATRAEVCDALAKFVILDEPGTEIPSTGGTSGTGNSDISQQELYDAMEIVIDGLEDDVIPKMTSDMQIEIINDIITNMNEYQEDNSYNYEDAAKDVYEKYNELNDTEQYALRHQIEIQIPSKKLLKLQKFFFPDLDI